MVHTVPDSSAPELSDWDHLAQRMGPSLGLWLLASGILAGAMVFLFPVQSSWPILVSTAVVLLAPVVFLLGWMAGMSLFAVSCETYRTCYWNARFEYVLPVLVSAIAVLGLLGGWYWWFLSPVLAILGHRKGTQRAWWAAVSVLSWSFRGKSAGLRLAQTDEEAITQAVDAINKQIGLRPRAGA